MSLIPCSTLNSRALSPIRTTFGPISPNPESDPLTRAALVTPSESESRHREIRVPLDARSDPGSLRITISELSYVGGDHWAAILDNIADLKNHFERQEEVSLAQDDETRGREGVNNGLSEPRSQHALLLYGCGLPASRTEILEALPPKGAVDRYISRYFNRLDLVHCQLTLDLMSPSKSCMERQD